MKAEYSMELKINTFFFCQSYANELLWFLYQSVSWGFEKIMPLTIPVSQVSTFPVGLSNAPFPPCAAAGCGSDARVCSIDLQTYLFSSVQKEPNPNCRTLVIGFSMFCIN